MKRNIAILAILCALPAVAADPEVVAVFEGTKITADQVSAPIETQLREIREAEYNLKKEAADRYVYDLVRKKAAEKEGVTVEELWKREVAAKVATPSDADVAATMRQYRAQLPADDAQARQMVVDALRQRATQERERAWRDELLAEANYRFVLDPVRYAIAPLEGDASIGSAKAPVTIVEFSDFQCPFCAQSQALLEQIEEKYGDKVRIVFKQLPLNIHPQARLAAEASLCARDQGKFRELHDWLFENPRSIEVAKMREVAPDLGIDADRLASCIEQKTHSAAVDAQLAQAERLGVNSTPTFFVNGRKVAERTVAGFARVIDEELASN